MQQDRPDLSTAPCLEQQQAAKLPRTLLGGTRAMRAAGEAYLPKFPREETQDYDARLAQSVLYPAFSSAVASAAGRLFMKPVSVAGPKEVEEWAWDADLQGRDLTLVGRRLAEEALATGAAYLYADVPPAPEGRAATREEDRRLGRRPYLVTYRAEQLLAFRAAVTGGRVRLSYARLLEESTEPSGRFGEATVRRVRELEPGLWRLWREVKEGEWIVESEGASALDYVPLFAFLPDELTEATGRPPFEGLAWLNVAHWQSASDQRVILHFARVPVWFGAGFREDEARPQMLGAGVLFRSENPGAKLEVVEHGGAAISSGRQDLEDLKVEMALAALQPLLPRSGGVTATSHAIASAEAHSALQGWGLKLGGVLTAALASWCHYAGLPDDEVLAEVNTDFSVLEAGSADVPELRQLALGGKLSDETLWEELRRRGVLAPGHDPEEEAKRLGKEAAEAARRAPDLFGGGGQAAREGDRPVAGDVGAPEGEGA